MDTTDMMAVGYAAPGAGSAAERLDAPSPERSAARVVAPGVGAARGARGIDGSLDPMKRDAWPRISDHVVESETGRELHNGVIVEVQPARPPHARAQGKLSYLVNSAVTTGYGVDTELLTRTSWEWDFASDVCIRKDGIDPNGGDRYLEEIAFEINYSQSESELRAKAQQMADRGVRRIFVIDVSDAENGTMPKLDRVREWQAAEGRWRPLGLDEVIEDPCLQQPLVIQALSDWMQADNAVARALAAKRNPVIASLQAAGERKGFADGERKGFADGERKGEQEGAARAMRSAIRKALARRGLALSAEEAARLAACTAIDELDDWLERALT